MYKTILKILHLLGVNRAISYGVATRIWGLVSGLLTMLVIGTRLTRVEQGYYYTINSLLALQIFFELGLLTVMAQFASQEFIYLRWGEKGEILGDDLSRKRFIDLLAKGTTWFFFAAISLILLVIPTGLAFLGSRAVADAVSFQWKLPWVLAVCGTALNLLAVPFYALIAGSGDVAGVNKREMLGALVSSVLGWSVLLLGGGLYAVSAVTFGTFVVSWLYLVREKPELLRVTWHHLLAQKINGNYDPAAKTYWWRDVWPLQWKMALTWITGYFIFQIFTPVLFRYQGAVVAGQMGMTLSAANALLAVSLTWISARTPEFGKLVAKQEWAALDATHLSVLKQSTAVAGFGALIGTCAIWLLQQYFPIGQRFVPAPYVALFLGGIVLNVMVASLGGYLRAHKQEPFLPLSLTLGVVQGSATWILGMKYGALGVTGGFFIIHLLLGMPVSFVIWNNFRKKWHVS